MACRDVYEALDPELHGFGITAFISMGFGDPVAHRFLIGGTMPVPREGRPVTVPGAQSVARFIAAGKSDVRSAVDMG